MARKTLPLFFLSLTIFVAGCGGGSFTPPVTTQAAITSAHVFSNTPQTWNFSDGFGHHMTIAVSQIACAFGSCGDISVWHYTKDSCAGYWNPHTPEQCAVATSLDELYFVLRHDADSAWRCIGFTYLDYLGNKFKVQISQQPGKAAPYTIIPVSSSVSDPDTAYNAMVQSLAFDADLTDFSAPAGGTAFSTTWRTDASAEGSSLISLQHEGCVTERWTFGNGLDKVIPLVGIGNAGCLTLDSKLTMIRAH
jgi:hypothetical protein